MSQPQEYPVGSKVVAPDGDGYDTKGVIEALGFKVRWDDGSGTHWLPVDKIEFKGDRPAISKIPADYKAKGQWDNGDYYGVTVERGGYKVRFPDSGAELWIDAPKVRFEAPPAAAAAGEFKVGEHVSALWTNMNWYGATIVEYDAKRDEYQVKWDDGSLPTWRKREHILKDV